MSTPRDVFVCPHANHGDMAIVNNWPVHGCPMCLGRLTQLRTYLTAEVKRLERKIKRLERKVRKEKA